MLSSLRNCQHSQDNADKDVTLVEHPPTNFRSWENKSKVILNSYGINLETRFSSNKMLSIFFEDAATDMKYFARRKFLGSSVQKKNICLMWQVVFKSTNFV